MTKGACGAKIIFKPLFIKKTILKVKWLPFLTGLPIVRPSSEFDDMSYMTCRLVWPAPASDIHRRQIQALNVARIRNTLDTYACKIAAPILAYDDFSGIRNAGTLLDHSGLNAVTIHLLLLLNSRSIFQTALFFAYNPLFWLW